MEIKRTVFFSSFFAGNFATILAIGFTLICRNDFTISGQLRSSKASDLTVSQISCFEIIFYVRPSDFAVYWYNFGSAKAIKYVGFNSKSDVSTSFKKKLSPTIRLCNLLNIPLKFIWLKSSKPSDLTVSQIQCFNIIFWSLF